MKLPRIILIFGFALNGFINLQALNRPELAHITKFADQKFPEHFDKERLKGLLQDVVKKIYFKGFRYLGDKKDFNHGHIVFIGQQDGFPKPVAILYHTQEDALDFHQAQPGSKYDYLDRRARNWIQWLNNGKIENAGKYERKDYPKTISWKIFVDVFLPDYKRHFTIADQMIDPKFLGGEVVFSFQWFFVKSNCKNLPLNNAQKNLNSISILLPNKKRICLLLLNTENYSKLEKL